MRGNAVFNYLLLGEVRACSARCKYKQSGPVQHPPEMSCNYRPNYKLPPKPRNCQIRDILIKWSPLLFDWRRHAPLSGTFFPTEISELFKLAALGTRQERRATRIHKGDILFAVFRHNSFSGGEKVEEEENSVFSLGLPPPWCESLGGRELLICLSRPGKERGGGDCSETGD